MRYFISDTHFGHANIIRYENRPFGDTAMMEEVIIARWNETVKDDDTVYFLGDFALGDLPYSRKIFNRLKGRKTAIIGNHDTASKLEKIGFSGVYEEAFIRIDGFKVQLVHIPMLFPDFEWIQVHGHVHSKMPFEIINGRLNVSCEVINYTPVSEKVLGKMFKKYGKGSAKLKKMEMPYLLSEGIA